MIRALICLTLVTTPWSDTPAQERPQLGPGNHTITLVHGGRERRYRVHVPHGGSGARPVMLAFHGGGGNAAQLQRSAGLDRVADREGFLAVYPDGTGPVSGRLLTWNAGSCCGRAVLERVNDVAFVRALVADLARRAVVDSSRIYATGHSNGAMMAYRLAVEAGDLVAAIVPVGGGMVVAEFRPSRPIPLLHIHSVDDPRALYDGGLGPPFPSTDHRVDHPNIPAVLRRWAEFNGCRETARELRSVRGRSGSESDGHTATRLDYGPCRGAPVEHWRLTGAGHGWPGASGPGLERIIGPRTDVIQAAEEVWRFVSGFRR